MARRITDTEQDRGCPEQWAELARKAEAAGRWHDADRLWQKASGVTIGHSRGAMYEDNAWRAGRKAAGAELLEEAIAHKPMRAAVFHKIKAYLAKLDQ